MTEAQAFRVGLDGFNLALAQGTGVATYGRTLSYALKGMGRSVDVIYGLDVSPTAAPPLRESLFFAALGEGRSGGEAPQTMTIRRAIRRAFLSSKTRDLVEIPLNGRVITTALAERLPAYDRLFTLPSLFYLAARYFRRFGRFMMVRMTDPPAIMHWTYPLPLRLAGALNVYTLHDLVPLRLPFTSLEDRTYYDRLIRGCIEGGDHICTVSEASRRDILDLYAADPDKVTNTYQAVIPAPAVMALQPHVLEDRLRSLFDLQMDGYFLFFGAIEPKKNLGRLIEAYLAADLKTPLVIAGPKAWKADAELRLLDSLHGAQLLAQGRIRLLGHLPRSQLMMLVRGAKAVLFPSLYEGFGLPAVEAMALGAPVLASTAGALPEVVSEAGLLVDPYDGEAMTSALRQLDTDGSLRARLRDAGPVRAQAFSLQAYQTRLSVLHDRLLNLSHPAGASGDRRPDLVGVKP